MNSENNKLCPFCESEMMIIQDNLNNGKPYLECPATSLRPKQICMVDKL